MYDLIIIGMGISGISAAIYAKRSNLKVLMLDKGLIGGIVNEIPQIENYPGINTISGPDLAQNLKEKIEDLDIEYKLEEVTDVIFDDIKTIKTKNNVYQTKNVLIASGRKPRLLGLEHEKEFLGRGISTCALCDGPLYKNKEVAVVGGGDSALGEAIYLSKIVKKVYLIHRKNEFRATPSLKEDLKRYNNIEVILNEEVKEIIIEDNKFKGIKLTNKELDIAALFIYIGFEPNSQIYQNTSLKMLDGYIIVNDKQETNIKGVYASGDITKKDIYQLVNASSEGATAAINISKLN